MRQNPCRYCSCCEAPPGSDTCETCEFEQKILGSDEDLEEQTNTNITMWDYENL